mgnify:CR=1 FL=1
MEILKRLAKSHENLVKITLDTLDLSMYSALWISFFKGVLVVLLLQWIF